MRKLAFVIIFSICTNNTGYTASFDENKWYEEGSKLEQSRSNLERINKENLAALSLTNSVKPYKDFLKNNYSGYFLLSLCAGTFKLPGKTDYAFGLINPDKKEGVYLALIKNKLSKLIVYELNHFKVSTLENQGNVYFTDPDSYHGIQNMEVTCNSWTEILRIQNDYQGNRNNASSATLRPINHLDTICVTPFDSIEEYVCYSLDSKVNKFTKIGGWFND